MEVCQVDGKLVLDADGKTQARAEASWLFAFTRSAEVSFCKEAQELSTLHRMIIKRAAVCMSFFLAASDGVWMVQRMSGFRKRVTDVVQ